MRPATAHASPRIGTTRPSGDRTVGSTASIWQEVARPSQVPASLTLPGGCARIGRFPVMASEPLIRVTGLRKTFGNHRVLDGLDLDVRAGEAVAVLGANGAGKTTLLKVLATLVRPTRGTAIVAGYDCAKNAELVRRSSHVYEDLTAAENLTFWATLAGLRPSAADRAAALATVELDRVAGERVRTFSAGMKRRLSLARFVLARPRVLLLDEPFTGLDQRGKKWLEEHLASFKAGGGAIVMTTHSFGRELV